MQRKHEQTSVFAQAPPSPLSLPPSPVNMSNIQSANKNPEESVSEIEVKDIMTNNVLSFDENLNIGNVQERTQRANALENSSCNALDASTKNDNIDIMSEISSVAENCCDRRSPCNGDDRISLSSWNNYPVHCPHMRIQPSLPVGAMGNSNQMTPTGTCPADTLYRTIPSSHQHTHLHPSSFSQISIPHQPSSLPEQSNVYIDMDSSPSRVFMGHNDHQNCMQKRALETEVPNHTHAHYNGHPLHELQRHHHLHQIHVPHSNGPSFNIQCNTMRHAHNNNIMPNSYSHSSNQTHGTQRSLTVESPQLHKFSTNNRGNFHDMSQMRPSINTVQTGDEKSPQTFSALSPADLCGYTSDTQDSRCCQNGEF